MMIVIGVLLIAGCSSGSDRPAQVFAPGAAKIRSALAVHAPAQRGPTLDEIFNAIGERAPGFAGMYLDGNQRLVVLYAAGSSANDAISAAANFIDSTGNGLPKPSSSREVRFSFRELSQALATLNPYQLRGVHYVDIDEVKNTLTLGVASSDDSIYVTASAQVVGLDPTLLNVRVMAPVRTASTLQDYVRPVMGGLQTATLDTVTGAYNVCASGPVVRIPGLSGRWILTASHCTPTANGYDPNSIMYQPVFFGSSYRIGVEAMDPPPLYGPPMCPAGTYCRQSDVAVYALDDTTTPFSVAHTTALSITPGTKGSLTLTTPAFDVTGVVPYSNLVVGAGLQHVGKTTGWSAGGITATCMSNYNATTGVWMMCNHVLKATMGTGDSGSPVFQWYGGASGYAANMAGVAWGLGDYYYTDSDGQLIGSLVIFNPWQFVTYDFGPLTPNP